MATQTPTFDFLSTRLFASRPQFLSFRDAAAESSLSERHLRRLYAEGSLVGRKVGKRVLIDRESFEKFLRS